MKRTAAVCALAILAAACGDGNPFTEEEVVTTPTTPTTPTPTTPSVPDNILNDLESISFNADDNTLTVTGLTQDGVPLVNEYRHVAATFAPGFETFTGQNDPIGRHATAFVASRDGGMQAGVVMTGPQFNRFFGGTFFERTGEYEAPTAPESRFDVTYVGNYAGGLNSAGPVTDLFPIIGTVDPDVDLPTQTAYVRGLMFVNVDLNDMSVEGEIYNRTAVFGSDGAGGFAPRSTIPGFIGSPDIFLVDGTLTEDGTFSGNLEVDGQVGEDIGDFSGVIGGPGGASIVGGTTLENYDDRFENEIEYGVFVLDLCTAASTDPICINAFTP
ncbi:hypothetical protein [Tateyamaria sp. SN3-11]|uniref:hypothetical protein n=1 Tax=Tateyamaria sp. SN3-11 TaxID=3092147 RepID=UPI0039EB732B